MLSVNVEVFVWDFPTLLGETERDSVPVDVLVGDCDGVSDMVMVSV